MALAEASEWHERILRPIWITILEGEVVEVSLRVMLEYLVAIAQSWPLFQHQIQVASCWLGWLCLFSPDRQVVRGLQTLVLMWLMLSASLCSKDICLLVIWLLFIRDHFVVY